MNKILIVVPDITRKAHLKDLLPGLLARLEREKTAATEIKIIIATGLHKAHTDAELTGLVGRSIFSRYQVISHTQDKNDLMDLGKTRKGIPIVLNKNVNWADRIITIGLVEPHLYAGYSGGAKTIAIGLAGEKTINATHRPSFIDKSGTAIGAIGGNPFQGCLWDSIEGLPVEHSINIVNNESGKLIKTFAGSPRDSFNGAVKFAKSIFEKSINKKYDVVICKVDPPKDANLYQASRAFNYILNTKNPIVKKGGVVLVCASLKEGFGGGLAERRFAEAMKNIRSAGEFIGRVKSKGCVAGEHRAYMVAKALMKAQLGFIGSRAAAYTKGMLFLSFTDIESALRYLKKEKGSQISVYVSRHTLSSILTYNG